MSKPVLDSSFSRGLAELNKALLYVRTAGVSLRVTKLEALLADAVDFLMMTGLDGDIAVESVEIKTALGVREKLWVDAVLAAMVGPKIPTAIPADAHADMALREFDRRFPNFTDKKVNVNEK